MESIIGSYKPAWFYIHQAFGVLHAVGIPIAPDFKYERHYQTSDSSDVKGVITYDVIRAGAYSMESHSARQPPKVADGSKPRVVLIIPGVSGDSEEGYIKELAGVASHKGYNVCVLNPLGPFHTDEPDLEMIDFTRDRVFEQAVEKTKEIFGDEIDLYLLGFSLGSNHMLRHLGTHKNCNDVCNFRAAVSVSSAFDIVATGIDLKHKMGTIYDKYILYWLSKFWREKRYKIQRLNPERNFV